MKTKIYNGLLLGLLLSLNSLAYGQTTSFINENYPGISIQNPNDLKVLNYTKLKNGPATPNVIPDVKTVDTNNLLNIIKNNKPILINVEMSSLMNQDGLQGQSLPNSLWFPELGLPSSDSAEDISKLFTKFVLKNYPNNPVVVYCESPNSYLSYNAIVRLKKAGLKNIYWYRGGLLSWLTVKPKQNFSIIKPESGMLWMLKGSIQ